MRVINLIYTAGELGVKEKLKIRKDAPLGAYLIETKVKTIPDGVAVAATSSFSRIDSLSTAS